MIKKEKNKRNPQFIKYTVHQRLDMIHDQIRQQANCWYHVEVMINRILDELKIIRETQLTLMDGFKDEKKEKLLDAASENNTPRMGAE